MSQTPRISIIVPARNEENTITSVLRSLSRQDRISECEVIVVDGESTDGTADVAAAFPFVQVVACRPGLAEQMNCGARAANAPILWFLHADSTLPNLKTVDAVFECLEDPAVAGGAFQYHLRGDDAYYKVITLLVNLRSRLFRRAYGDQGIFVRARLFKDLGGFREIPASEDIDLVLRLRAHGAFRILSPRVETSARTWQRHGKVRTTAWHIRQWLNYEFRQRKQLERRDSSVSTVSEPEPNMQPSATRTEGSLPS